MSEERLNGFVNMGGWIPLATDWKPYIGEWWFGAHHCVEDNLRRQIAGAAEPVESTRVTEKRGDL